MNSEYETILSQVRRWPVAQRIALLEDVLHTFTPGARQASRRPKDTFSQALGLLRSDKTPASDEEIDELLAQHRMEKYG